MFLKTAVSLAVGTLLGFLSGLGIGGGSLLLLWLTLALDMETSAARAINLLFFLPSAVTALYLRRKQGCLPGKKLLPAMVSGAVGAAVFTLLGRRLNTEILRKLFGILLLFTGAREIAVSRRSGE